MKLALRLFYKAIYIQNNISNLLLKIKNFNSKVSIVLLQLNSIIKWYYQL